MNFYNYLVKENELKCTATNERLKKTQSMNTNAIKISEYSGVTQAKRQLSHCAKCIFLLKTHFLQCYLKIKLYLCKN